MGRHLTLGEALASDRQAEAHGVELASGSDLERALALLVTQRRLDPKPGNTPSCRSFSQIAGR